MKNLSIKIAPSLLSCNFSQLEREIKTVEEAGCDVLHLDVMDGHFVPNITFGPVIIDWIRKVTTLPLDAHLMILNPEKWIKRFVDVGVDWISFHPESTKNIGEVISLIKEHKKLAGLALNPDTPLEVATPWLKDIDFVVIMTVNPGFGGQEFIKEPLKKVEILSNQGINIEVDGGVKLDTILEVIKAGAHIIVSGSGIFKTSSPPATIKRFKEIIKNVTSV
jgi:ribulose-phosphate 3-epimerase